MNDRTFYAAHLLPALLVALGCAPDAGPIDPDARGGRPAPALASDRHSDWSPPANLGPIVNSPFNDLAAEISKDGLSLYFASNRPGGLGGNDIYVSRRAGPDEPWGAPVNLGEVINTAANEAGVHLSRDGHWMLFTSTRPGGAGGNDLYLSRRTDINDDFAWEPPQSLGAPVNSTDGELGPSVWGPELYLWRGPVATGNAPGDIYMSEMKGHAFGAPTPVEALNSPAHDEKPGIRFDGREIYLASNRAGGAGLLDLWVSTRQGNGHAWEVPANLGPTVNTAADDRRPALSGDGTLLFFDSNRPGGVGGLDLYVSTRTRRGRPGTPD